MLSSPSIARRSFKFLLRQPERVLALVLVAFICGSALALWLTSTFASDSLWPASDQPTSGRSLFGVENGVHFAGPMFPAARSPALRANANESSPNSAFEKATLQALHAVEQHLTALDSRLADAERASTSSQVPVPALASMAVASTEGQLASQVASLSQTVAAVLSLVASEQQRTHALSQQPQLPPATPAPPPPPPPPPPEHWSAQNSKLEEIKQEVSKKAEDAAKAQVQPEIDKLKKILKRLSGQETNHYTQVLKELSHLSPVSSTVSEEWGTGKSTVAPVASPEQAAGHACRSPPCSRDVESCKFNENCCADLMYEMLVDFSAFLTSRNVTHFVVAGTLLGAVRDQDIIPYTADIDMVIPRAGWERAKEINFIKGRRRSYYFMQDPQESHCARVCAVWDGLPVNRASFTNHFDWDTDQLGADVQYYMDIYDEDMDFAKSFKHLFYPLSNVTIRNQTFPAPGEKLLWVEAQYGPTWRTPDHKTHGQNIYPSHEEGERWSKSMLMLRKARSDAVLGHRLLERATVDIKTGHVVVDETAAEVHAPEVEPKQITIEGLRVSLAGNVTNGTVVIWPPDTNEGEITHYVLHWATEQVRGWDLTLKKIGSEIMRVPRCSSGGDPFLACGMHGLALRAPLPWNAKLPTEATHLAVSAANEAGTSSKIKGAGLIDDVPGSDATFSRRSMLGIFGGLAPDSPKLAACVKGTAALLDRDTGHQDGSITPKLLTKAEMEERVVALMIRKTPTDMRAALRMLTEWLQPVVHMLGRCGKHEPAAKVVRDALVRALGHLSSPKEFNYEPGKALSIDGTTIFLGINHAIGELRKDNPATFGMALGELLKPLGIAPAEKAFETPDDLHYHVPEADQVLGGLRTLGAGVKYLLTSVKAAQDVHIALTQHEAKSGMLPDNSSVLYDFLIGGSMNKVCALRFIRGGKNEIEVDFENALDSEQFMDFWVSADSTTGRVALGRGHNISTNVIFNLTDAPPGVRGSPTSFAVMSSASVGAWRFPKVEQDYVVETAKKPVDKSTTIVSTSDIASIANVAKPQTVSTSRFRLHLHPRRHLNQGDDR